MKPARHESLQDGLLLEANFRLIALVDERGCRRDIRSNGWNVISKSLLLENRSGRRNRFSSFGADHRSAISPGSKLQVKSGPDVFADALVPKAGTWCSAIWIPKSPTSLQRVNRIARHATASRSAHRRGRARCDGRTRCAPSGIDDPLQWLSFREIVR